MNLHRLALPVLAFALGTSGVLVAGNRVAQAAAIQRGWDAPPDEFRDVQRQGFHDGLDAGREDAEHHHRNMEKSRMYRHPPGPPEAREDYREGFRRGYDKAFEHYSHDRDHDHD